jgi:hypothetical protein
MMLLPDAPGSYAPASVVCVPAKPDVTRLSESSTSDHGDAGL